VKNNDPYSDRRAVTALRRRVESAAEQLGRPATFMEVCGTHTHAIARAGLRRMLPEGVRLISGPGCPVCVTPVDYLDRGEAIARLPQTIVCTFGDLLRVPSSHSSLEEVRAGGADVRVVYSASDAVRVARENPERRVVFLAVGFETTLPTIAAALAESEETDVPNFSILSGAKRIEPPLRALVDDPAVEVDGFLLPGHVSVILGSDAYHFLAEEYGVPSVVVGFGPVDVLSGIEELLDQMANETPAATNLYPRVVRPEGNRVARALLDRFFEPVDTRWRGLGEIPASGLDLREEWRDRDAGRIEVEVGEPREPAGCRCGEILQGRIEPPECPLFAGTCTPDSPVGACMVSSEGTCAAWYRHERQEVTA